MKFCLLLILAVAHAADQPFIVEDPKFYGRIYGADIDDDPADPRTWIRANPSLKENGGFLDIEKVREQALNLE